MASGGVLLAAADTYVVVLALPNIMGGVGLGLDQLQQATPIVSGFLVGYTVMLPPVGRLSDRYGRPPALVGCLILFAAGSVVTASAESLAAVVVGRVIQGVGGGGLVPVTLALVADLWPPERRGLPLGVVGAVQESGSLLGPLYGAVMVAAAGWRSIFWINVPLALALALALGRRRRGAFDLTGAVLIGLASVGATLTLSAPGFLADNSLWGRLYSPLVRGVGERATTPVALATIGCAALFTAHSLRPRRSPKLIDLRRSGEVFRQADALSGLLLALALAAIIISFASADPSRQVVASGGPVLLSAGALAAFLFGWRQRRVSDPLVEFGALAAAPAWGALLSSLFIGAALMAALVDIPIFARATAYPHSQLYAALTLVRFLVAVPVGAVVGGYATRARHYRAPAAVGMLMAAVAFLFMSHWGRASLTSAMVLAGTRLPMRSSDVVLVAGGFGFGLTVAPINTAILNAVRQDIHGLATSLVVVARTVGMLVGLSALTGIGLHRFYDAERRIGSPLVLCPRHPNNCPAYDHAVLAALLSELHTIFLGAAISAGLAALAAATLRVVRLPAVLPTGHQAGVVEGDRLP